MAKQSFTTIYISMRMDNFIGIQPSSGYTGTTVFYGTICRIHQDCFHLCAGTAARVQ